jgi:hypothetical protein
MKESCELHVIWCIGIRKRLMSVLEVCGQMETFEARKFLCCRFNEPGSGALVLAACEAIMLPL